MTKTGKGEASSASWGGVLSCSEAKPRRFGEQSIAIIGFSPDRGRRKTADNSGKTAKYHRKETGFCGVTVAGLRLRDGPEVLKPLKYLLSGGK